MHMALTLGLAGVSMWGLENVRPRRRDRHVTGWHVRAIALSGVQVAAAFLGAVVLDPWLQQLRLFSAAPLGLVGGILVGYLAITFLWYWWHRARHEVPFLWRTLHQVHHSPTRLELLTTYFKHPLESASNVVLGGFTMYVVLGLTPAQSAGVALLCGLAEFFYHWNVTTPRWIGWFVQRPESHCVHHERGRHTRNYGDLPLWDWLFGTLDNPAHDEVDCGFGPDEDRLTEMLCFQDVASPPTEEGRPSRGATAWILVVVGTLAMVGDRVGSETLYGLGLATGASPAPKVFTAREGLEGFSSTYTLAWDEPTGPRAVVLTPDLYARLEGPYNRRNVYGAALAGGPFLATHPSLAPLHATVAHYAFCEADVLGELGIDAAPQGPIRLTVTPRADTTTSLPLALEVGC
jgi:sterol desaturase/sphingolipid hydroxylase (fatty acid hydroxylase superfamily)